MPGELTDDVLRYTAFTSDPAGGNPAGVVLDARGLDAAEMVGIAAEVGYSETAFLVGGPDGDRRFGVRYFSPKGEVSFCGHATVASAVALAERIGPGEIVFATASGAVPVSVTESDGRWRAELTSVGPYVEPVSAADVDEALALLGWRRGELDESLPPRIAYAGARHLVLAAATRERLAALDYDFAGLAAFMTARDLTTVHLVWRESADTFHVRDPFPVGGVVEDPATGAAAAAFGAYLRSVSTPPSVLTLHQGVDLGRPAVLRVELRDDDERIRVSGTAVALPQL